MIRIMLLSGGILQLVTAFFHIGFWRIFNWGEELSHLSVTNRAIMQTLNICLIYIFIGMAVYSFHLSRRLSLSGIDRILLLFIAGLFVLRAFLEFPLFGYSSTGIFAILSCLVLAACYVVPVLLQGQLIQNEQQELSKHFSEIDRLVKKEC